METCVQGLGGHGRGGQYGWGAWRRQWEGGRQGGELRAQRRAQLQEVQKERGLAGEDLDYRSDPCTIHSPVF